MKILFERTVTLYVLGETQEKDAEKIFQRNQVIDIKSIDALSRDFVNITLPSDDIILDVRKDWFRVL